MSWDFLVLGLFYNIKRIKMNQIKVKHPDGSHVVFTEPTLRQKQILDYYSVLRIEQDNLAKNIKNIPNDSKLGRVVRKEFIQWEV